MIILYEEYETEFTSLGLGILRDATECIVNETLNDEFTLEMKYPITGANFSKIKIGRIISVKPNPYDDAQPFRITSITKAIKGIVTINANHISYDMNGIPIKAIDAKTLSEVLSQLKTNSYITNNFNFITDSASSRTFKTYKPYNLRALLLGDEENSIVYKYDLELKFDKFNTFLYEKRGKDRGAQVCYGYNMTDLKHETKTDKLYSGVFPYYHTETTSDETTTTDSFKQAYIVGTKIYQKDWLSYTENGEPFEPYDDTLPVQIATEGDYYQNVYTWDYTNLKWKKRIYNESVTLIEGVTSPSWIIIDWSNFPKITCRANAKGYFKSSIDTEWSDIKGVGDEIFSGNIITEGISGFVTNLIIYYSEVIPSSYEYDNTEVSEIVEVILDDPIIKLNTSDASLMTYDKILMLDLTSEFDEEPTKEQLKNKAENYISKNKLGNIEHTTTVSFIDLQNTTEAGKYKNFEHVELGDTVRVIYKDLNVDVELRAISTKYNVLNGHYNSIELGVKDDNISSQSIQNGDNISSLTNDSGYADITTVNKLIANIVTAEYISAANSKLSKAQIEQLNVEQIECKGIFTASQFVIDEIVAKMLTAENAKIAKTLEAGNIKVSGDITINSGSINISSTNENGTTKYFNVDRYGNVIANSLSITGGEIDLGNGVFNVDNYGNVIANNIILKGGNIVGFNIDEYTLNYVNPNNPEIYCKIKPSEAFDTIHRKTTIDASSGNFNLLFFPLCSEGTGIISYYSSYLKKEGFYSDGTTSGTYPPSQYTNYSKISTKDFKYIPTLRIYKDNGNNREAITRYTKDNVLSNCGKIINIEIPNSRIYEYDSSGPHWMLIDIKDYEVLSDYIKHIYSVHSQITIEGTSKPLSYYNIERYPIIKIKNDTEFYIYIDNAFISSHSTNDKLALNITVIGE